MDKQLEPKVLPIYKPRGLTPLQTLNLLRVKFPEYKNAVLSYAGRLDPMAEGVLLVLIGETANKKESREKYLGLDKEYEVEILLGIETDTYDILGKVTSKKLEAPDTEKFSEKLEKYTGVFEQPYPPYSSKPVLGKPLFVWARENRLSEIHIPTKSVTIFDIKLLNISKISTQKILEEVIKDAHDVVGDFRQEEIKKTWQKSFENTSIELPLLTISLRC